MPKEKEQPKGKSPKREPKYDESPEVPQWKIDEERDDLMRLTKAFLARRYKAIYKSLGGDKTMTLTRADALAILQLIDENNTNLLALLEHQFEIRFLS
jgi:hypothetical protein